MATSAALVTVEEFRKLQDPPGVRLDLHNGEVVHVRIPSHRQWRIQKRLASMLETAFGVGGEAGIAFGFRPKAEYELRVADVAWISKERLAGIDP